MLPQVSAPAHQALPTEWLSVDDVSQALGVTAHTVRNWIAQGSLAASRIGPRLIRIRRADLEAMLEPVGQDEVA
jgi:excisionase family DNA binding protein